MIILRMKNTVVMLPALCLAAAVSFLDGCSKKPQVKFLPAGSPMADFIHFEYGVYMMPRHAKDPSVILVRALSEKSAVLKRVEKLPEKPSAMFVAAHWETTLRQRYGPPSLESLNYSAHGLTDEQGRSLQDSKEAFVLDFGYPKQDVWVGLHAADELIEKIARETGGLLWDEETREVFTADAWHDRRLRNWRDAVPNISTHTFIHLYENGDFVRAISLGMAKAGLPDVVVEELDSASGKQVGSLINAFSQSLAEGATFESSGRFKIDLRSIQNSEVREGQLKSLQEHAVGIACVTLVVADAEEGDPKNRLVGITFDRYRGNDSHARRDGALKGLYGWTDAVHDIEHTSELLDASRKAREELPKLYVDFHRGLKPGQYILVKAPFAIPGGGNEWMWVEVRNWNGHSIKGILENEPERIPGLHGGQLVEVREDDVFDYERHFPEGTTEGNTTGDLIRKMEESKPSASLDKKPAFVPECKD